LTPLKTAELLMCSRHAECGTYSVKAEVKQSCDSLQLLNF